MIYQSFFFSPRDMSSDTALSPWQSECVNTIRESAEPWLNQSFDDLRALVFGPTLPRAWQVWSDGHCPACKEDVRMYDWQCEAVNVPWKLTCPHCAQQFPTNDFESYYNTGLDDDGIFQFNRADRSLLYNAAHPDADDPLRDFGVDDGNGYHDGDEHWRFIAAYLVFGQWKQRILTAVVSLADAYSVTGERRYGNRAAVLLHRIADVYSSFCYREQGVAYEKQADSHNGYVSIWHDACEETRELALAYDRIIPCVQDDNSELTDFIGRTAEEIHEHIRQDILIDALNNPPKMHCNYPRRNTAYCMIRSILDWENERDSIMEEIGEIIHYCTRYDGTSGEKGLAGYDAFALVALSSFLAQYLDAQPQLLEVWLREHPTLVRTWRFHIDTWCLQRYFPSCGDAGCFAKPVEYYPSVLLPDSPRRGGQTLPRTQLTASMLHFLFRLYEATHDPIYAQLTYHLNNKSLTGLPKSMNGIDENAIQENMAVVIQEHGEEMQTGSVDFPDWHLAIQRSGTAEHQRVLWMDYDAGGMHGHKDGLNLGLYSHQLDLLPDFGYPAVGFGGGWFQPKANWYITTAAHNTVLVDRQDQDVVSWKCLTDQNYISEYNSDIQAKTTFWIDDTNCHGMRCGMQAYSQCSDYNRLAVMIDIDEEHYYILDVFRVVGGNEHIKFTHSQFADLTTTDLTLTSADEDFGPDAQMRHFEWDANPGKQWSADWAIDDRYEAGTGVPVNMRYTDLTHGAAAGRCEAWVVWGKGLFADQEAWIPRLMTKREQTGNEPFASCFVSIIEPYTENSSIESIERLNLDDDMDIAIEIHLADGRIDRIVAPNIADNHSCPDWCGDISTDFHWSRLA
ncbi:heparinase II/III family protein [bacterium AH-315-E10]|nr:heparinase II/III family protein [bacterium AH-315-E10]